MTINLISRMNIDLTSPLEKIKQQIKNHGKKYLSGKIDVVSFILTAVIMAVLTVWDKAFALKE